MEVSSKLHNPAALFLAKESQVAPGQEARWAPEPVWMLWRREKSCSWQESNPGHPACSPLLYRVSYPGSFMTEEKLKPCTAVAMQQPLRWADIPWLFLGNDSVNMFPLLGSRFLIMQRSNATIDELCFLCGLHRDAIRNGQG
jgi:hypothetical protein